jgi:broad specificity phosphatase PhoE
VIYLLRHGETVWNTAGRYQGHKDSPLTARGREQAASLGRTLAEVFRNLAGPIRTYVSPLGRAQGTADIVARHVTLGRITEPRLKEVSIGSWDGMSHYEISMEYPDALSGADAFDWFFRSQDGERLEAVKGRVSAWLTEATTPSVVISHGLTGRIIRGVYLGLSRREVLELPWPEDGFFVLSHKGIRHCDAVA